MPPRASAVRPGPAPQATTDPAAGPGPLTCRCRRRAAADCFFCAGTLPWADTNFGGHALQWFGVETPRTFPETGEAVQDLSTDVQMWLAYGILAGADGHVAAAFKHRWFDGQDVIRRMTLGTG